MLNMIPSQTLTYSVTKSNLALTYNTSVVNQIGKSQSIIGNAKTHHENMPI